MQTPLDREMDVDGARIAYTVQGSGPPVVLVHGTPSHSIIWRDVIPRLAAAGHRVFAYDLLGFGASAKPDDRDVDVGAQADLLVKLMDAWDLPRAHVVGHDIGGAIALILAVRSPKRVNRLAVIDTVSYDSWPSETWRRIRRDHLNAVEALDDETFREVLTRQLRMTVHDKERMTGDVLAAYLEPWEGEDGKRAFFHQVASWDSRFTQEIADDLTRLQVPVKILWGESDEWQPVSYAERLAADVPGADLTVIPDAGHFLMEDAPERVADELTAFLASG